MTGAGVAAASGAGVTEVIDTVYGSVFKFKEGRICENRGGFALYGLKAGVRC